MLQIKWFIFLEKKWRNEFKQKDDCLFYLNQISPKSTCLHNAQNWQFQFKRRQLLSKKWFLYVISMSPNTGHFSTYNIWDIMFNYIPTYIRILRMWNKKSFKHTRPESISLITSFLQTSKAVYKLLENHQTLKENTEYCDLHQLNKCILEFFWSPT